MKNKLMDLRDKLNNISKSNRSIRLLKNYNKSTFDLYELNKIEGEPEKILNNLLNNYTETILKVKQDNITTQNLSNKLTSLYRNVNSIEEETGQYDLYLGYPFIEGSLFDHTYIRGPLFLYPIKLTRVKKTNIQWKIETNTEDYPQLNRTLFLALQKINEMYFDEDFFQNGEEIAKNADIEEILEWLQTHGFNISNNIQENLMEITNYNKDEIPEFNKNSYRLNNQAAIGLFSQGDSAVLKDYDDFLKLLEDGEDLGIVDDFLNLNTIEHSSSLLNSEETNNYNEKVEKEKGKSLVLDTDASQEQIIENLQTGKGMVVDGPPGTGKSQVITNIISNAMSKGEKVMLVTQKRAALDVVYQRLDSLNLTANVALLHDEKNDRPQLYSKINNALNRVQMVDEVEEEHENISNRIVAIEREMDDVSKALFTPQHHGYRALDLYSESTPNKDVDKVLDLKGHLSNIHKNNLKDVLDDIEIYANYYDSYGTNNPLHDRKPFNQMELTDKTELIETLQHIKENSKDISDFLDHFNDEEITPQYSMGIDTKLEKVYDDLDTNEEKTLQKLRVWLWTSFTGKTIIEDLLDGEKFKGMSSKEWPAIREKLTILYDLSQKSQNLLNNLESLRKFFEDNSIDSYAKRISKGDIPLKDFENKYDYAVEYFDQLREMDTFYDSVGTDTQAIIDSLIHKHPEPTHKLDNEWSDLAEQSIFIHWIDEIESKHPDISKVSNGSYEKLRHRLEELLSQKQELTRKLIQNKLNKKVEEVNDHDYKAVKSMLHQTNKKSKIWKVRRFVNEFSNNGLIDVMPVWLVSPEVASAIFPLQEKLFDLVIFDEASQCTVENGLPAIYRGNKVVIAGDEQQLPPSTLFKSSVDLNDEDDEEETDDFHESESLLNLGKRILPNRMLEWHYRSKSEELINFSNHSFYNGAMQIAPNVNHMQEPASIQWHKSQGQWINQRNNTEAEDTVKLLKDLLIKDHNKSIGIITFNKKQQETIENLIDNYNEEDPEFSAVYNEVMKRDLDDRIFVKNIENVQGDERDIIIFSIAYAKNKDGKVHNRFGTLGQKGGENRLNVAVTRAKEAIHVVASIEPSELDVSNTKNIGPKLFKYYLTYAKEVSELQKENVENVLTQVNTERNTQIQDSPLHFDSGFEEQVYEKFRQIGYQVDTQVGMSSYRIDLAIVDPNDSSRYVLGVECDGAMYHSSPSARARDIYRQRYLESQGWHIERIWSRNWWKDPNSEIERIDQKIKSLSREKTKKSV
ncbi:AAA domain-containing protein [Alkalibacillus salilacus]|uniref:Very-short-patch-repair endonuclease/ABC-type iron transport system FetAB ATPase subunit n=1 Tax=Alkalibacillus salilacus TaxID=284582 RepID=A0ABT9VGJ1_9BACI|nr:AAA domain-containing protein [Alkalibacillus salilacus]MDQ0160022.1 very-short-patch-repair endonuclease/ABC-type iron transport system FetAB ATPase subunit [Alkalibacillus salilacus]